MGRLPIRHTLGLMALASLLACTPKPTPAPRSGRPAAPPREDARRPPAAPTPAPKGPDIAAELLVTARIGAVHRLDRRLAALAPAMVPAPLVQGLFTRRLLPELARDIGLNALALDALDFTRPAVIGLLVRKHANPHRVAHVRPVALLPLRGEPKLVNDALKVSWPDSTETPWGAVQIRSGDRTVAWVHAKDRWVVVAPTGPLCDSAARALLPLVRGVSEGTVHLSVRWAELLTIFRGVIAQGWQQVKALEARAARGGARALESLVLTFVPLAEQLAPYLASLGRLDLSAHIGDDAWSWDVKVTPTAGGPTATWIAGLRSPKRFGLALLPPKATLVTVDRRGEAIRGLSTKLLSRVVDLGVGAVISRDLPAAVRERGLLDKPRPASLLQFRRTLRDLNLKDYQASYHVYRLLFALKALRAHFETHSPRLAALTTGEIAGALYAEGGRLGFGMVEGLKNPAAHRKATLAQVFGLLRLGNQLLQALWALMPAKERRQLNLRALPLQVVFNPVALRVGRITAASLSLRIRWPSRSPVAKRPGAPRPASQHAFDELDQIRRVLEHLLGKGDPTYAWATVGSRLVTTAGHDWRARMREMLQRATPGSKAPGVLQDPMFQQALAGAPGDPLSLTLVSGARLLVAALDGFRALAPTLAARLPGPLAMILKQLEQGARGAQTATRLTEAREGGAYVAHGRIPTADLKGAMMGAGMLLFGVLRSGARSSKRAVSAPAIAPAPPAPYQP